MRLFKFVAFAAIAAFALPAAGGTVYYTDFEGFDLGDVQGQNGWGYLSNSPTIGGIVANPVGTPGFLGGQSLQLRSEASGAFAFVANGLWSPRIDAAGETGAPSSTGPAALNRFGGSFYYRTPDV